MNALMLAAAMASHPPYPPPYPPGVYPQPVVPVFRPPFPPGGHFPQGCRQRPVTVDEFERWFQPRPGHHDVWIIHPRTGQPVNVCFDLPFSHHRPDVDASRSRIEIDCGRVEVEIRFLRDGRVQVEYDD